MNNYNEINDLFETQGLYERLVEYSKSNVYPFHMPGHKRNEKMLEMVNPYEIDITEVDGFDNLHSPKEIILNLMNRISKYYKTDYSYLLVNGSSCGLLTAISAVLDVNDEVIVARNCHKSVYNAIFLRSLKARYIMPEIDEYGICKEIYPETIEKLLSENKAAKAVIITSPTYEGNVSDIKKISSIVHKYDKILIVDEAHGAHFGRNEYFPVSAYQMGADIVIQSIHKTLPAMTQTAIMHINKERVSIEKIRKYLSIYQSSSPSYILMASVDRCFSLLEKKGDYLFAEYVKLLKEVRSKLSSMKNMCIYGKEKIAYFINYESCDNCDNYDRGKIVILIKNKLISGKQLYDVLLNNFSLQMEMCENKYVIAMTSICDTKEGMNRLVDALLYIDENWNDLFITNETENKKEEYSVDNIEFRNLPDVIMPVYAIDNVKKKWILIKESINNIAAEYIYVYPPGIPIIVPGEKIDNCIINIIENYVLKGLNVIGLNEDNTKICVVNNYI